MLLTLGGSVLSHSDGASLAVKDPVMVCQEAGRKWQRRPRTLQRRWGNGVPRMWLLVFLAGLASFPLALLGQESKPDWQAEVRKCAETQDWARAMSVVERELAYAPQDEEARTWRARVLTWMGRLGEAEHEYSRLAKISPNDPDHWLGLASVYLRESRFPEAIRALDRAVELDPKRADLHAARGRALRAGGDLGQARLEFQKALELDPRSEEARAGLTSIRMEAKQELRVGSDNDLFNFANANHGEWMSLVSRWTTHWTTSLAGNFYQRGGTPAGEFVGGVTGQQRRWGALTIGGASGHDNGVIPKCETFFEYGRGWKTGESGFVRGVEAAYGQHWYWYTTARILTLRETITVCFPRNWTWFLGLTEARSHFSAPSAEWRPSGTTKLGFPMARWRARQLNGNIFYAAGTENYGQVDQVGSFSSQTYGGGLRFQWAARQDVTVYGAFQRRSQKRTDTTFGFSYGIHF